MSKNNKKNIDVASVNEPDFELDIPDDEIWTYQIPGLAAPHINKPYKHFTLKKIIFIVTILLAVGLSFYFSILAIANKDTFEYETVSENAYRLTKFSNTGEMTELHIDYVTKVEYNQISKEYVFKKDENKKVTEIREYALNCDDKIKTIYIGADVEKIDGKSFYSCWALENIEVDENNPYYCEIDGVLYDKAKTELINYPCNHDEYLRKKFGYEKEMYRDDVTEQYRLDIQTYVVPSTVTKLGELCFAYTNIRDIYLPKGLKRMETLSVFKLHEPKDEWGNTPSLENIYTYKTNNVISDTSCKAKDSFSEIYLSLPEGLEYIGSDSLSYNQAMSYIYIPSSVTYIGHHAFWDDVYKEDNQLKGISVINVAASEAEFDNVEVGDQWRPQYDYMLFKKSVDVNYGVERQSMQ